MNINGVGEVSAWVRKSCDGFDIVHGCDVVQGLN